MRNRKLWQLALASFWLTLFIATHVPVDTPGLPGENVDKLIHLVAFATLGALFATTWEFSAGRLLQRHLIWAWILIAVYGALDEGTQNYVGRQGSLADWLADGAGAALGLSAFVAIRRWLKGTDW